MSRAAEAGNVSILEWYKANACPWDDLEAITAAECGNLGAFKWCFANDPHGYSNCRITLAKAATRGHLEVVSGCGPTNVHGEGKYATWLHADAT